MNSALVDFYNLHLRSDLGINNPPNEEERQRIIKFFETYAPNVVRKLTDQKKQQLRDFFCYEKRNKLQEKLEKALQNNDPSFLEIMFDYKLIITKEILEKIDKAAKNNDSSLISTITTDVFTSLEGYEITGLSWFDSSGFENFAVEYHRIKELIDKHLDDDKCVTTSDRDWLQSRINMYLNAELDYRMIYLSVNSQVVLDNLKAFLNKYSTKIFQFELPLREIFPSIHQKAMSVLKKELTLRYCNAPKTQKSSACKNIFMPQAKGKEQQYCSKKCANRARRREYYLKHGK